MSLRVLQVVFSVKNLRKSDKMAINQCQNVLLHVNLAKKGTFFGNGTQIDLSIVVPLKDGGFRKGSGRAQARGTETSESEMIIKKLKIGDFIMVPSRRNNQNWLPGFFNDFFDNDWMERSNATAPAINVLENEKSYDLELAAPGMTKDDFNVTLDENGDLVINMEKKQENKEEGNGEKKHAHYLRREFSYSKFQQTMLLPDDADREKISAQVEHGVLKVNIPKVVKVEPEVAHKVIEVK